MKKTLYALLTIAILAVIGIISLGQNANAPSEMAPDISSETDKMEEGGYEGAVMEDGTLTDEEAAMMEEGGAMMHETKVFDVEGANFAFSQTEIRVKKGDTVRINYTSTDGFHDFVMDEFGAATERVNTGGSTYVEFVADQAGTFEYYCSVGSHRQLGMVGNLIVEEN